MKRLIVSITIRRGIRRIGVPSGRRWPRAWVGWFRIPIITVASQRGTANPKLRESCVVGVKVYGSRPSMLRVMRKSIKAVKREAHLCPVKLIRTKSCRVSRLMNQACRVSSRLFSHRPEGAGNNNQGRLRARIIRGTPRSMGLINWSKKLRIMVSFRLVCGCFLCFVGRARLGICGKRLLEEELSGKLVMRRQECKIKGRWRVVAYH